MMQLLCNGARVDLYDDASLQFTKKNPLFAFDALSAERTTSFKLPATPTNDRVFSCARVPAYKGDGMRKRFNAELQAGTVVKRGYLYVSSYSKNEYNAVMVCDMLFDLKAFGNYEWGSLIWNKEVSSTVYNANAANIPTMARIKYHRPSGDTVQPAINIGVLLQQLDAQGILPIKGVTDTSLRLIRKGDNRKLDQVLNVITSEPYGMELNIANSQGLFDLYPMPTDDRAEPGYINALYIDQNGLTMTFADDTPDNVCLCGSSDDKPFKVEFLGTRKFLRPLTSGGAVRYEGTPLKGQTITVPGYKQFVLMTGTSTPYDADPTRAIDWAELDMHKETPVNVKVRVSGDDYRYYYSSQLTDLNISDVLKLYSAYTGTLIGLDADGNIRFFDSITPSDNTVQLIELDNVQRGFGDWAQKNYVRFKQSEYVLDYERKSIHYDIENDNLQAEQDILVLECVEGGQYDGADTIMVRGAESGGVLTEDFAAKAGGNEYLQRVSLVKDSTMQALCDASTTVVIQARMSMADFSNMDSSTTFLVRNTQYMWVEAQWQKDVAKFTLVRM